MFLHANRGYLSRKQKPVVLDFSQDLRFQSQPIAKRVCKCILFLSRFVVQTLKP